MDNFQLYRTNLYLGGQMKWDIIIGNNNECLYVDDFHLTPISANISYTYRSNELLINNSHRDNIKAYYTKNKGNFYNTGLQSDLTHNWPVISFDNILPVTYSNIYDAGCKRSKQYALYNKQFEFFCPLWIEKLTDKDTLSFNITVSIANNDKVIGTNTLKLSNINEQYHDKFVKYFKDYVAEIGLNEGSDDVLNIDFKSETTTITGIDASTGIVTTKYINELVNNLMTRERPLMETDNLLIQSFVNNTIVCKQLFNFNICFNIDDIIIPYIAKQIYGEQLKISVEALINDIALEKRDFYTEYEYINKFVYSYSNSVTNDELIDESTNVLSYLNDNLCIDLINKNKFNQSICHWSLCNNNDYIFNIYNGFSGLYVEQDADGNKLYCENTHQYGNTPNLNIDKNVKHQNPTGWINAIEIDNWFDFYKYVLDTDKNKQDGVYVDSSKNFLNNIKYSKIPSVLNGKYILGITMPDNILAKIQNASSNFNSLTNIIPENSTSQYIMYTLELDELVLILTNDSNTLTFKVFKDIITEYINATTEVVADNINGIYELMSNKIDPKIIYMSSSLSYMKANSPSTRTNEITYYKDNDAMEYVVRYDGKIKPTLKTTPDTLYYKDVVLHDDINTSVYTDYEKYGLEPLYPSIGYYAIKKLRDWTYDNVPHINSANISVINPLIASSIEYTWFDTNLFIILNPLIEFNIIKNKPIIDGSILLEDVKTKLIDYYKLNSSDTTRIDYIVNRYDISCDSSNEYVESTKSYIHKYNITLKLK